MTTAGWTIDLPHYTYANLRRDWWGTMAYGLRWVVGVV
jgi:hypothetical protein